jgi:rhamnosyltransferase
LLKTKPNIAVLFATFNGEAYLATQLKSLQHQESVDVFIIASDDCSSDSTPQYLTKASALDQKIIVLPTTKLGSAAANFFRLLRDVDLTYIDYVALSDQDDIWHADKLCHAVDMISAKKVDAYSSNVTAFWPDGSQALINKSQPQRQWDYMFESPGPGCTFVISKVLALDVQEFLVNHQVACQSVAFHDWFIYAFARSRGYQWFIDTESHILYRQHPANVVGANVGVKAKLARFKKLREGWLVKQALLIAETLGYSDAWPIQKLKRYHFFDRLTLILNISKLRRRTRDRVALAFFLLWPLNK